MNDVVLAVVGGAARRWLQAEGRLPERSLVAGVPVATDAPGAGPRLGGNRVSNIFTSLATDIDDPHERLQAISRTTGESKLIHQTLGPNMLVDWVQFAPPAPLTAVMRLYSRSRAADLHAPPFNMVVSNVRGPGEPVSISGAHLRDLFSVGPILEGIGLNVTAWSYVDRMNFSFLGCPDLVDDLAPLVAELPRALEELRTTKGAVDEEADRQVHRPLRARSRWAGRCVRRSRTGARKVLPPPTTGPAAPGTDGRPARPRPHLRHRRGRPHARCARGRARCTRWAATAHLALGARRWTSSPQTHRVDRVRPAVARARDPLGAVPVHRLCRRRGRGAGRARRGAGDRRRLLDGWRDRAAGVAPAPRARSPGWCSARRPATSAGSSARSSSSR